MGESLQDCFIRWESANNKIAQLIVDRRLAEEILFDCLIDNKLVEYLKIDFAKLRKQKYG